MNKSCQNLNLRFRLLEYTAMFPEKVVNFDQLNLNETMMLYYQSCINELKMMWCDKVYDNVSIYHLLVNDNIIPFVRNQIISRKLYDYESGCSLSKKFPLYGKIVYKRFIDSYKNHKLIENSNVALSAILRLPFNSYAPIFDIIQEFLHDKEKYNLSLLTDEYYKSQSRKYFQSLML